MKESGVDRGSPLLYSTWTTDLSVNRDQPSSPAPAGELATEGRRLSGEPSSICSLYSSLMTRLNPTTRDGGAMLLQPCRSAPCN
ncbi:DNA topoisomerase IV, A subunit, proteobacterial [Sesbania bispinosa]|nr:DNA topoisomerase IV, A subunit, proteobacterial [Sesbania bispinosa]